LKPTEIQAQLPKPVKTDDTHTGTLFLIKSTTNLIPTAARTYKPKMQNRNDADQLATLSLLVIL
jgi:hypothetical protein